MPSARIGMLLALALAGAACTPPYIDKDLLPFAKDYWRQCGRENCLEMLAAMPLDRLYAAHLYGRSFHPWRSLAGAFARRGGEAVPFLRAKLEASRDGGEIGSLFEIFAEMRRQGSYDVGGDAALVAAIQSAAHRAKDPGYFLRDQADELETGEKKPFGFAAGLKWTQGLGSDYDTSFAKRHCRGCDWRDWRDAAKNLPIEQLYAVQRYGWEHFYPPRNLDSLVAQRGASAIPFLKTRLAVAERGLMLLNILSVLELMRHLGTFEPRSDAELIALVDSAAARADGDYSQWIRESAERLRTGATNPRIEQLTG